MNTLMQRWRSPHTPVSRPRGAPPKWRPVLVAALLMSLALAFNAYFNLLTLESVYRSETLSRARVVADALRRDLQREVRFRDGFSVLRNVAERLTRTAATLRRVVVRDGVEAPAAGRGSRAGIRVFLTTPDGTVIASSTAADPSQGLSEIVERARPILDHRGPSTPDTTDFESGGTHYLVFPVRSFEGRWIGALIVELDPALAGLDGRRFVREIQGVVALTVAGGIIFLVYLFAWQGGLLRARRPSANSHVTALVFTVLLITQLISSALVIVAFRQGYYGVSTATAKTELAVLRDELEPVLELGIDVRHLADLEPRLQTILDNQPVISEVTVSTLNHRLVAHAERDAGRRRNGISLSALFAAPADGHPPGRKFPVYAMVYARGEPRAVLTAWIAQQSMDARVWDIAVQGLTLLVIGMLLARELLVLARRCITAPPRDARPSSLNIPLVIRPAIFFFMFGIDLSMSFVPLQMKRLYDPIAGLPEEFMLGLPISAEFLCVGIALLVAGLWIDRRGWIEPFFAGILTAALGAAYSGLAPGPMHFVVARGLVGVGYGLTFMAAQGVVIRSANGAGKTGSGLAQLFAGLYAGSLSGGTVGAMLADHISFEAVFLIGAGLVAAIAVYALLFIRGAWVKPPTAAPDPIRLSAYRALPRLLIDRNFLCVMLFSSLPAAIAVVGLVNFFSPLYLNGIGANQTTIGQVMLVYGLCLALAGPWAGQLADRISDKRIPVYLGASLGALSLMSFVLFDGLGAALTAMVLLGPALKHDPLSGAPPRP